MYDGTDEVTATGLDGREVTYRRNLDVDGPGAWRVMSIAARFGKDDQATYQCWVIDVAGMDTSVLNPVLSTLRPYGWNANFDRGVLARGGVMIRRWWDVMLFDAVLKAGANGSDQSRYTSLARAAARELDLDMDGKDTTRLSYDATTKLTDEQIRYAGLDAVVTLVLGDILGSRARALDLADTVVRESDAQPLIDAMVRNGLPMDVQGYLERIIAPAQVAAADAAERIAVLTGGGDVIATASAWARSRGLADADVDDVALALRVLHEDGLPGAFAEFISDVRIAGASARESVSRLAGGSQVEEDLFSDGPTLTCPFVVDDDNDVRRWLSKQVPTFAACVVASYLDPQVSLDAAQARAAGDPDWLVSASAGKKRLVKDHDLDAALVALASSPLAEVSDQMRSLAKQLAAYRRYQRILERYGAAQAPVALTPDWKLSAPEEVKDRLNRLYPDLVKAHFARTDKAARLLEKADSVDSDTLKMIGGDLAGAILDYRKNEKIISTYGEQFLKFVHPVTGRIHARYKQGLTGTGRLASEAPNAQNLPPAAKAFLRPDLVDGKVRRVLVAADLSQAELRYAADRSGDVSMLEAFATGEDLHERTASTMFSVKLKMLKEFGDTCLGDIPADAVEGLAPFAAAEPGKAAKAVYKELRQKAKRVAFGYAYGLQGASLAQGLTVEGVPTTKEEADDLLRRFDMAYPQLAAWMADRVATVERVASAARSGQDLDVDLAASWLLHLAFPKVKEARAALKAKLGYTPSADEVSMFLVDDDELARRAESAVADEAGRSEWIITERARLSAQVSWAAGFDHPVVLRHDGSAWMFSSRTAGGRVRWFPVLTGDWEWGLVTEIVRSRDAKVADVRRQWVERFNAELAADFDEARAAGKIRRKLDVVTLSRRDRSSGREVPLSGKELEKMFEDRARRTSLVRAVFAALPERVEGLQRAALAGRVRRMVNQFRNHPIQGGVADAMLVAMGRIDQALAASFPSAQVIQSVHDSLVVECDVEDALRIRDLLVSEMEDGLRLFCPGVVPLAEADIQESLDDKSRLSDDQVAELSALWCSTASVA